MGRGVRARKSWQQDVSEGRRVLKQAIFLLLLFFIISCSASARLLFSSKIHQLNWWTQITLMTNVNTPTPDIHMSHASCDHKACKPYTASGVADHSQQGLAWHRSHTPSPMPADVGGQQAGCSMHTQTDQPGAESAAAGTQITPRLGQSDVAHQHAAVSGNVMDLHGDTGVESIRNELADAEGLQGHISSSSTDAWVSCGRLHDHAWPASITTTNVVCVAQYIVTPLRVHGCSPSYVFQIGLYLLPWSVEPRP